jgi:hypothetical protein
MSAAVAVRDSPTDLDIPGREAVITAYLTEARDQIALAVQAGNPSDVSRLKAEIATAAEATKQLGLSKEIQQDALEMVRRAEYALGKAIRAGQEAKTIAQRGGPRGQTADTAICPQSPYDFAKHSDLYGDGKAGGNGILAMADNATEPEFEAALAEAKAEGNVSRANVVRKIRKAEPAKPEQPSQEDLEAQVDLINDLQNHWSRGLIHYARIMSPKARGHVIRILKSVITAIEEMK